MPKKLILWIITMMISVNLYSNGSLKWGTQVGSGTSISPILRSTPAISDNGNIYTISRTGSIICLNATNGSIKWKESIEPFNESSVAVSHNGNVYFGGSFFDHLMYCYSSNGNMLWTYPTTGVVNAPPAISQDGTLFFGDDQGYFYAVRSNGELLWEIDLVSEIESEASIGIDGTLYVMAGDYLTALDYDGTIIWQTYLRNTWNLPSTSSPAIGADGTLYVAGNNAFHAINPDGSIKWTYKLNQTMSSSPAIAADGTIYIGTWYYDHALLAFNPNGTLKWKFDVSTLIYSSPAVDSNGRVYFTTTGESSVNNDDSLYCLNPDGTVYWKKNFSGDGCSPIIGGNGILYIGSNNGYMNAFYTGSSGPANSDWPFSGGMPSRSSNINYNDNDAPQSAFSSDITQGDAPLSVKFSNGSEGNITQFLWDFGDDETSSEMNPTHTFSKPGYYNISLISSNNTQKDKTIIPKYITAYDSSKPIAKFEYTGTGAVNTNFSFKDLSISPDISEWNWDFGDQSNSTLQNPAHKYKSPGFYNVMLNVTDFRSSDSTGKMISIYSINEDLPKSDKKVLFGYDNKIYVPNYRTLKSINEDVTSNWTLSFTNEIYTPMQANDSTIYFGCGDGKFYAVTTDGEIKWSYKTQYYVDVAPALGNDGSIIAIDYLGYVYSLNSNGNLNWKKKFNINYLFAPVVGLDGTIYLTSSDNYYGTVAVNPDGSVKWEYQFKEGSQSPLALSPDGTIYYASKSGYLHAINEAGEQVWSFKADYSTTENPLVDRDGNIYFIAGKDLYCLNSSGELLWIFKTRIWPDPYTVIGAGDVIYLNGDSYTYCLNKKTGEQYWNTNFNAIAPLAISNDGKIFGYPSVLETGCKGLETGGWPSVHFDNRNTGNINSITPNFQVLPDSGMQPLSVTFINQTQGANLYFSWDFGDGTTSTLENPVHIYTNPGIYSVSLTASNSYNSAICKKDSVVDVTVDIITVNFSANDTTGFQPFTVEFENGTTGTVDLWLWNFGDGYTSDEKNPKHIYGHYGDYTVSLIASDAFDTVTLVKENYIHVGLKNDLQPNFVVDTISGNYPLTVNFKSTSQGTIEAFLWDFGDGTTSTEENPTHTYQNPGVYSVSLTISNVFYWKTKSEKDFIEVIDPEHLVAKFDYDNIEGAAPVTIHFNDLSKGNVDYWEWNFGDGTISYEQNPEHYFDTPGEYTIQLIVSNEIMSDTSTIIIRLYKGYDWYYKSSYGVSYMPVADKMNNIYIFGGRSIKKIDIHGNILWEYKLENDFYRDPVLGSNNIIYGLDYSRTLYAIDTNGNLKWKNKLSYTSYNKMAISNNNILIVEAYEKFLMAVDTSGTVIWQVFDDKLNSSPVINKKNEIVIGNTNAGITIYGIDGNLRNEIQVDNNEWEYIKYITLENDSVIYAVSSFPKLYKVNLNTGVEWVSDMDGSNYYYSNPTIDIDGNVYYTDYSKLNSLNETGSQRWSFESYATLFCSPSIDRNGNLYLADNEYAYCLNKSGELIWDFYDPYGYIYTPPVILNDGTILICSSAGIYGINTNSCGYPNVNWPTPLYNLFNTSALGNEQNPEARFSASKKRITAPDTIQFTDASIGEIDSWQWDFGDGNTSTEENPLHTYQDTGKYTVRLVVVSGGQTDTVIYSDYIWVEKQNLVANFEADITNGEIPLTVNFNDLSEGKIENWLWNFGDGSVSDVQYPVHIFESPDTFTVSLVVNGYGASDTLTKENYIVCTTLLSAGDISNSKKIILYPNPVSSMLTIGGLPDDRITQIEIFTLNGKKVIEKRTNSCKVDMDLTSLARGAYYLQFNKLKTSAVKILKR